MMVTVNPHNVSANPTQQGIKHQLWSIAIDAVTMEQALATITRWVHACSSNCHLVVTPNVDHVVQLHRSPDLFPIFRDASLVLADGWPLVSLSRLYGCRLPQRVAGSDLLPRLCESFDRRDESLRVYLFGGMNDVPQRAANELERRWSNIRVVGHCSPPLGFEHDAGLNAEIVRSINDSGADVLVVGLGFPKQERWLVMHRHQLRTPVALAVGATIDFFAGEQRRAPNWMQQYKLEWLHRMASDPKRLIKRYAQDAVLFPLICVSHWMGQPRKGTPVTRHDASGVH